MFASSRSVVSLARASRSLPCSLIGSAILRNRTRGACRQMSSGVPRRSVRGAPAPTSKRPPATLGQLLMPARVCVCHSVRPSDAANATTRPASVGTKTTSPATVAQPVAGEPSRRDQTFFPVSAISATRTPLPRLRSAGNAGSTALSRMQRSTTGTKSRPPRTPSASARRPSRPGQTRRRLLRQRPEIVEVRSDRARPEPLAGDAVPRDDAAGLARSEDDPVPAMIGEASSRSRARRASSPGRTRGACRVIAVSATRESV